MKIELKKLYRGLLTDEEKKLWDYSIQHFESNDLTKSLFFQIKKGATCPDDLELWPVVMIHCQRLVVSDGKPAWIPRKYADIRPE